ncbi:MAG: SpoIIE family protein phosphatase [Proteobacteria bacterium]|nr:SpoIIE family protein phosphatase [Pseudomonadota bacterium]MBU1648044.1 SpoIIE family protein phosphatase [Pseudomonadota bacterium]
MNEGGILLVDDNLVTREVCKNVLSKLNVPVHCVADGEECLEKVFSIKPDLILLDIRIPTRNSFNTLQRLQENQNSCDIPVIILSSDSEVDSVVKALSMGARDYLKKPFAAKELLARCHNVLRNRQAKKRIADDLAAGIAIQKKFLTNDSGIISAFANFGYQAALFNKPSANVSGDFYYPVAINADSMGFFFADTCGHGLSAALISMRIIGMLSTLRHATHTPELYLQIINEDLCGLLPMERFIAASYCTVTASSLTLANAGQPHPLHIQKEQIEEIEVKGYPVGQFLGRTFTNKSIQIKGGDKIVFYTDGLTEAENQLEECYSKERLIQALENGLDMGLNINALVEFVINDVFLFCDPMVPDDDITLVIIEKKCSQSGNTRTLANTQEAIGEFLENFRNLILHRLFQDTRKKEQIEYVLMEALDNAWEHGNKKNASMKIIVDWTITLDFLTIFIKDEGEGFHHTIPYTMPPDTNPRGRGLFTMNEFAEAISFNSSGNQITLRIARGEDNDE